jgi:hypothetical protein
MDKFRRGAPVYDGRVLLVFVSAWAAITVAVEPTRVTLTSPPATAQVVVDAPGARAVRLWASTGVLSAATETAPGRFTATYQAPASGPPSYAVVAAWDEAGGPAAAATIALEARIELPVETEPGAQVQAVAGGRRASARGDPGGRARVLLQVPPGVRVARVTATDRAGNATVEEVELDVPPPPTVWLVAPAEVNAGAPVRVYAFAVGGARPRVSAPGGQIEVEAGPGVASAQLRATRDLTLTAAAGGSTATAAVHVRRPPPSTLLVRARPPGPPRLVEPRWELGASVGPRYSGALVGGAVTVEGRHRIGRSRWHLGLDLEGVGGTGSVGASDLVVGGVGLRGLCELRGSITDRIALFVAGELGAFLAHEKVSPAVGRTEEGWDGAPSVGLRVGLLAWVGPGLLTMQLGYAWTPLVGQSLAGLDGAMLALGYRAGRW